MKQALIYSLKVWLTSSIVSAMLLTMLHLVFLRINLSSVHISQYDAPRAYHQVIAKFPIMVGADVVLLIPLWVALYFTLVILKRRVVIVAKFKWYLSVVGICCVTLPLIYVIGYEVLNIDSEYYKGIVSGFIESCFVSTLSVLASIWFYKLKQTEAVSTPSHPSLK